MKYIQSFYQYPVTFSSIGKTIPARSAKGEMRNIAEVSDKELEKLNNCEPFFRELVNLKKVRILNHLPASYVPPAQQINAAHEEADKMKAENAALKVRIAELEAQAAKATVKEDDKGQEETAGKKNKDLSKMEYKELQELAKEKGINPNQKKAALIAELEK